MDRSTWRRIIRADLGVYLVMNVVMYGLFLAGFVTALIFPELTAAQVTSLEEDGTADLVVSLLSNVWLFALVILGVNTLAVGALSILLPSMILPFVGIAVFAYRAFDIGLSLAPTDETAWVTLIPHSLTILIEFQAYILLVLGAYLLGRSWLRPGTVGAGNRRQGYVRGLQQVGRLSLPALTLFVIGPGDSGVPRHRRRRGARPAAPDRRRTVHPAILARSVATAVALALLLVLGACAQPSSPPSLAPAPPPAELARFYDQELAFGPCAGYATTGADEKLFAGDPRFECARLEVPLDYGDPAGATGQVAMLRVPARGESMGSLLLNSGGPGGTGMNFAALVAGGLAQSRVTERFDLVGFDPRGVGATTPAIDCFTDEELRAGAAQSEFLISAGSLSEDGARELVEKCAQGSGGEPALAAVATRDTVRDMDVLRSALGEERLNFFGQSYGTRVGAFYAAQYPQRVRAMVLDGAVDPRLGLVDRRLSQWAGFQRSFEQMAADCATRPDCPLGPDPARATQAFQDIVRPLLDRPVPAEGGLTYNDAVGAVISGLYYSQAWPMIIQGLAELRDGRSDTLGRLLQLFSGPDDGSRLSNFSEAAYAIVCMDEERLTVEQARDVRGRIYEVAPFADPGRGVEGARDSCEAWPAPPKPTYPFPDRVEGVAPTLVVSITGDPTTPYDAGIRLAEALGGSLLTVEGEQHTVVAAGTNACVTDHAAAYLIDLRTPPADARCTL